MRIRWFALSMTLAACATSPLEEPRSTGEALPSRVEVSEEQLRFHLSANEGVQRRIESPPEEVWAAVLRTFDELEIPPTRVDPSARVVASTRLRPGRSLAGESLVRLVNCGSSISGPAALTHRVELSIQVALHPAESGTTQMAMQVGGQAIAPGSGSGAVQCRTTGRLEELLVQQVGRHLQPRG